jgi:precorrin-4 C11-methyltransferase
MTDRTFTAAAGTVYFVGAGPGAPDLITVRGREIIAQADLILYADSLVEESVADLARKAEVRIARSSGLHLEQVLELMVETVRAGGVVARVHSGDPALYGAIHEQMASLDDYVIPYEIVPGVTAAFAVAAQLKTELTVPDLVQTIILTRTAGRTTMPQREDLRSLAAAGASLAIYLSVGRIRQVVDNLLSSGGYQPETPVVVSHKVTWPDESHIRGTLADIADKVKQAGYTKHALILVSPALDPRLKNSDRRTSSHLYDKSYSHRFRRAEDFKRIKEQIEARGPVEGVVIGDKHLGSVPARDGAVMISLTRQGSRLALQLAPTLGAEVVIPAKFSDLIDHDPPELTRAQAPGQYGDSALAEVRRRWARHHRLVLIMPAGIAVRAIAPLLGHKSNDPAVLCLDESGRSVIPLLGGHRAGANELARQIAALTGGQAAITTASDVQGKPALDLPPSIRHPAGTALALENLAWHIEPHSALTHASACLVNGETLGVFVDPALDGVRRQMVDWLAAVDNIAFVPGPDELDLDAYAAGLIVSHRLLSDHHRHLLRKSILYRPPVLVAGLGCRRGVPASELRAALETTFRDAGLSLQSIVALATADLKAAEKGLQELAQTARVPLKVVESAELAALDPTLFSPSAAQLKFNLPGVAEPSAVFVAGPNCDLIVPKRAFDRCTVAVTLLQIDEDMS